MECCNAPDATFHIRNSNSCLFRRCYMIFPSWLGFICCFAFCSCYASRLMSLFALHRHHSHCIGTLLPSLFSNLHPLVVAASPLAFVDHSELNRFFDSLLSDRLTLSAQPPSPSCALPKLSRTRTVQSSPLHTDHPQTSTKHLRFLNWAPSPNFPGPSDDERRDRIPLSYPLPILIVGNPRY